MLLEEPSSSAAAGPVRPRRLSELLREIADDPSRERIAIADMLLAMKDRAIGALLLIFALPNVLPTPPGTSTVLGAPLIFLAAQLALGRPPWLPKLIANRSIARRDFAALMNKAEPWLARAEKLLKPRLSGITRPPFEYGIGAVCFALAIILFLPIPLGNMLPALTICMLALGVLERDGVWIIAGLLLTATSVVLVSGVVYAIVKSAIFILTNAFA
ncbi:ABC transporter permease [Kaistia algarum]|uniref:exopolysaccharide biosynthesis protein n=1 Tax=Kaistia algarum TaxID=2083279 RepID=UPI000CE76B77|nr:exopolysaccharide biosynthesis protein [Kaistia algarum]MCX5516789.1 exopolysaccharide biosynthesis protein [Kaistia algarum]PPE77200.1 ABC transporter permease [Kaistia algarum]